MPSGYRSTLGIRTIKGAWAEDLALSHLEERGYRLVARNRRAPYGEIGLWMLDSDVQVFMEVKQCGNARFGSPLEAITARKLARIRASALTLLGRDDLPTRFEAVLIYGIPRAHCLEHLPLA